MKKILIVEDDRVVQNQYSHVFRDKVSTLQAFSIKEARSLFSENPDVDLIVMDACVDNLYEIDSLGLISEMRETFLGPMVASSRSPVFQDKLMNAGCDYKASKFQVPEKVFEILKI